MVATVGLKMGILKYVPGALVKSGAEMPDFEKVIKMLRRSVPSFNWRIDVLKAEDYKVPSNKNKKRLKYENMLQHILEKRCHKSGGGCC